MISNLVLLGATGFLGYGYYCFKLEGKLVKFFDELMKFETYDIDYVKDLSELPQDKDIVIQGTILHNNKKMVSSIESDRDIVYKEFVVTSQQVPESEIDYYYKGRSSENIEFNIGEPNEQNKQIQFNFKPNQIYFYNPFTIMQKVDSKKYSNQLSLLQKIQLSNKKYNLTEYALTPNSTFSYVGRISPITAQSTQTNNLPLYRFIPKVIMSDNKDYLLQHLDRYLVILNEKGKRNLGLGFGIIGLHFVVTKIIFAQPKEVELPQ